MAKYKYDPGRFSDLFNTPLGPKVWDFLTDKRNLAGMIAASDLGRPAVAGLGTRDHIVGILDEEVTSDRWKQAIGHMVRQIMEAESFELATQGLTVGDGSMFSRGSRYRRRLPHWGHVHFTGNRRGGGVLWGDRGADSLGHALEEIEGFVRACIREEIRDAKVKVRERGASPGQKPSESVSMNLQSTSPTAAQKVRLRSVLSAGTVTPNIDLSLSFTY